MFIRRFSTLLCLFLAAAILLSGCKPNKTPPASSESGFYIPIIPDDADGIIKLYKEYLILSEFDIQILVENCVPREKAEMMDWIDVIERKENRSLYTYDSDGIASYKLYSDEQEKTRNERLNNLPDYQKTYFEKLGIHEEYILSVIDEFGDFETIMGTSESEIIEMYNLLRFRQELHIAHWNFLAELRRRYEQLDLQLSSLY